MAEGELGAVFKALARDAEQAAGDIGESTAKVTEKAADLEEANVARTLEAEAQVTRDMSAIAAEEPPATSSKVRDVLNPRDGTSARIVTDAEGNPRLLNADRAKLDPNKFTGYALNPDHPVGGNKAKVFAAATGFTKENADDLMTQIRRGVVENEPALGKVDQWGERFTVEIPVAGPTGAGTVTTGWIFKTGEDVPTLTTLLMKGRKK